MKKSKSVNSIITQMARDNFLAFCQLMPSDKPYEVSKIHKVMADVLVDAYEKVCKGEKVRIILSVPPRHGKSVTASVMFPAWALGKNPDLRFILSTYAADLAEVNGRKARDIIASPQYQTVFPNIRLRADLKSKRKWMIQKKVDTNWLDGGDFTGVGVGGSVTGRGADCITGDTIVETDDGQYTIEHLYHLQNTPKVLSYSHDRKQFEYKSIQAKRKISDTTKRILRITTEQGREIVCTEDHKFFDGEGYKEIRLFKPGEVLWTSGVQGNTNGRDKSKVRLLWNNVLERIGGVYKSTAERVKGFVLWPRLFTKTPCGKKSKAVFNVQRTMSKKDDEILSERMQAEFNKTHFQGVPSMQEIISAKDKVYKGMWAGVCGQSPFCSDENEKPKLQTRDGARRVSKGILQTTSERIGKGWKWMCDLFKCGSARSTSYRQQSGTQCAGEPCYTLQEMPPQTSQLKADTISMVEEVHGSRDVYDIQVEDNHNFVASGILVHNCIIVDDPHKGRIEAESSTDRQRVYEYYKSTLYSRLEGHGAVILIMQRWHEDDLVGRLTDPDNDESKDEWTIVNFPAVAEEDEYHNGELFRKRGEPLWPEKFGLDVLANIRMNQGPYNWSSQYQQEPIDKENALFRESMFSYYDDADLTDQNLQYYTFMDPNSGRKSKDVDEVVVLTLAKTRDNPRIYRIREDAGRYTIPQAVDILFKHIEEYDPVKVVVEHNALQNTFKYVVEEEQRKRGVFFKIYPVKKDNKEQRIMGMVPLYEQGLFKHRHTDKTFEEQLLKFPSGRHDDRIDCQSFCLEFLKKTSMVQKLAQYIPQTFGYYEG